MKPTRVKPTRELHMTIEATPNEVIAMNVAIDRYLTYFYRPTEEFRITARLLLRFRQRLVEQLPTMPTPPPLPTQPGKG